MDTLGIGDKHVSQLISYTIFKTLNVAVVYIYIYLYLIYTYMILFLVAIACVKDLAVYSSYHITMCMQINNWDKSLRPDST